MYFPILEASRLQGLEEKLKNGGKLSKNERQEMRAYILGLKTSAALLTQTASELQSLLARQ